MNNFLTSLLGLNLYVYGLGVALTSILFMFLFWRNIRKTSYSEEKLVDALFAAGVFALIIGRLGYILMYPKDFDGSIFKALLLISNPGVSDFFFWLGFFFFWLGFALRRKYSFKSLVRLLLAPIVVGKIVLTLFSLVKSFDLLSLYSLGIMLFLIGLYFLVLKLTKSDTVKNSLYLPLSLYLALPPFMVDFFNTDRVYFLGLNILSYNQLPYLVFLVLLVIIGIFSLVKRKK